MRQYRSHREGVGGGGGRVAESLLAADFKVKCVHISPSQKGGGRKDDQGNQPGRRGKGGEREKKRREKQREE